MTAPAPLPQAPDARERAIDMHYSARPMAEITLATGLTRDQVLAAVDEDATVRRSPARSLAAPAAPRPQHPAASPQTAATVPPPSTPAAPTADDDQAPPAATITELITWAQRHDDTRIRTVARRVREGLTDLHQRRVAETAAREHAAEIERLTAELDAAKARARAAGLRVSRPKPTDDDHASNATDDARIRRWAAQNNRPVYARGRIPASLRAEYYEAHPNLKGA